MRTRVRWGGVVACVVGAALTASILASGVDAGPVAEKPPRVYVVQPGDTVWSIAGRHARRGTDPRPMVDLLIRLNRLQDAIIRPGQRLVLPS